MLELSVERLGATLSGRRTFELPCTIGRSSECDLVIDDPFINPIHGQFTQHGPAVVYTDQKSLTGTIHRRGDGLTPLGGKTCHTEVWEGDRLELGDSIKPITIRISLPTDTPAVIARRDLSDPSPWTQRVTNSTDRLQTLYRFGPELSVCRTPESVLDSGAQLIYELIPSATHITIALSESGGRFPVVFAKTRSGQSFDEEMSRTLLQEVISSQSGVLVTNAQQQYGSAQSIRKTGLASALCVPLWIRDTITGVIQVDNRKSAGLFGGDELDVLTVAAGQIALALDNARLVEALKTKENALQGQNEYLKKSQATHATEHSNLIGKSVAMTAVIEAIHKVCNTRVPVLIQGETGTGKELVARALHASSQRAQQMFIAHNCSAVTATLLESELFGHVKGAFTGADRDKKGLFELADGGTIFLDELGEMALELQAKLLRVIQEGEIRPVGATQPRHIDVRIVSATHRDLDEMVRQGTFRQDLYYRLNVYPIRIPALRERREDIPILAEYFLKRYGVEFNAPTETFADGALTAMMAYEWPGNVRELQNEIQRVLIHGTHHTVQVNDLSERILGHVTQPTFGVQSEGTLKDMMDAVEKQLLVTALKHNDGNKTQTAKALGITREGLHKKLNRHGIL